MKHRPRKDAWERKDIIALAGKPSTFLGTLLTPTAGERATGGVAGDPGCGPGADSVESYRPTLDYRDWYNDVQYLKSDSIGSYYPAERSSLILASLHKSTNRGGGHWTILGGGLGMGHGRTLQGPAECSQTMRIDKEVDSAGSYMDYYEGYAE
ncbi:hypothetical protein P4O66_011062 [Electrophorus voltai]|uniref:Uncharacterized protein n=1 Tax=Electrophorus voltai TaxID=2609070 RepID=A0AAD8Z781_9TELE|nr:hypothetical protein P4O66_011062 [Electrophorus voltai]